jgi:hypothetical protein
LGSVTHRSGPSEEMLPTGKGGDLLHTPGFTFPAKNLGRPAPIVLDLEKQTSDHEENFKIGSKQISKSNYTSEEEDEFDSRQHQGGRKSIQYSSETPKTQWMSNRRKTSGFSPAKMSGGQKINLEDQSDGERSYWGPETLKDLDDFSVKESHDLKMFILNIHKSIFRNIVSLPKLAETKQKFANGTLLLFDQSLKELDMEESEMDEDINYQFDILDTDSKVKTMMFLRNS